jgi:hypothetical protein
MAGYDNRKVAQNRTSVKRDFGIPFNTIFQAQDREEPQPIGGGSRHPKVTTSCHGHNLGKVSRNFIYGLNIKAF